MSENPKTFKKFDDAVWSTAAIQGDVAGIALYTKAALESIVIAMEKVSTSTTIDVQKDIKNIQESIVELDNIFNEFTGYEEE